MEIKRQKGESAVMGCEAYADTPHGRLRYDLLTKHYASLIREHSINTYVDVGGGNGILAARLLNQFPSLNVRFFDDDPIMVERANELLKTFVENGQATVNRCSVLDLDGMRDVTGSVGPGALFGFNHVIEYIDDKQAAIDAIIALLSEDALLGVMYLNNSCEALRRVLFKDSVEGVSEQLKSRQVNMGHFGLAEALETDWLEAYMIRNNMQELQQFGMRCVSDFKSPEFAEIHYDELLKLECQIGSHPDFMGFARYRLKFYRKADNG